MSLLLEVLLKNNLSEQYPLYNGLKIGRKKGDILINDLKMSALHACIETDLEGHLKLVDLGSANGIIFEGRRVKKLELTPGLSFQMGHTRFRIVESEEASDPLELGFSLAEPDIAPSKAASEPLSSPLDESQRRDQNQLSQILQRAALTIRDSSVPIRPFSPPLKVSIINGPQAHTQWILSYGPRKIGSQTLDLLIFDQNTPDVCFELVPQEDGTLFMTAYPDHVLFNGKEKSSEMVKDGDEITIINSLSLKVHWYNEND